MYLLILTGFAAALLIGDLAARQYVEEHFKEGEEHPAFGGKIIFRKVHNKGLMLNVLDEKQQMVKWLSAGAAAVCAGMAAVTLARKKHRIRKTAFICLLAGAAGNLYDRFLRGYVVDYIGLKTKWKKLSNITFNIGDILIFAGTLTAALTFWKKAH